ncbi:MAG: enoyl-CoA hydratase-related protein [Acidimicrobiales bacterium]
MSDYGDQTANPAAGDATDDHQWVLLDDPIPGVRRITFNRAEKRNSMIHPLREPSSVPCVEADDDPSVKVSIIRGDGPSFSAGYDLAGGNEGYELPFFTAQGEGQWPRHVTEGWMSIWDLSKPVIAQVHGYCLAGGSELATCCDLVYMAEDAQMGYPPPASACPTCTSTPGSWGCARRWR